MQKVPCGFHNLPACFIRHSF